MMQFSTKFKVELSHQLFENHVLLSAVDPPHGVACSRLNRFVCLAVLLTSQLTLTAAWFGCIHTASDYELMTGVSTFRSPDVGVATIVALISFLLAALLLEIFHCNKRKVCTLHFGNINLSKLCRPLTDSCFLLVVKRKLRTPYSQVMCVYR